MTAELTERLSRETPGEDERGAHMGKLVLPRSLRHPRFPLGLFVLGFLFMWVLKETILVTIGDAVRQAVSGDDGASIAFHFPSPSGLFRCYVQLAAVGGILATVPWLTLRLVAWLAPRCALSLNPSPRMVLLPACLALVGGVLYGHFAIFLETFAPIAGSGGLPLADVLFFAERTYLGCVLGAEMGVVLFFYTRAQALAFGRWSVRAWIACALGAVFLSLLPPPEFFAPMLGTLIVVYALIVVHATGEVVKRSREEAR